jgi:hypothetical protein
VAALGGALGAALLTAGLVLGSRVPWRVEGGGDASIRLSWRVVGERIEQCREPTAAEQANLPPHMRQTRLCERRLAPFRLAVRVDGAELLDASVRPSGAREDRPTYVFHELRVPPGEHRLELRFEVERPPGSGPPAQPPLLLDERVRLAPRRVLLVTRAAETGALAILSEAAP